MDIEIVILDHSVYVLAMLFAYVLKIVHVHLIICIDVELFLLFTEELLNNFSQTRECWRHSLYFLANTHNQYVMMYCMTVLEVSQSLPVLPSQYPQPVCHDVLYDSPRGESVTPCTS